MQRRTLLRSLGAAGLGAALAGCLSSGSPGGEDPDTTAPSAPESPTETETPTDQHTDTRSNEERTTGDDTTSPTDEDRTNDPAGSGDSAWDPAAQKPFEILEIGSRDDVPFPDDNRPHEVAVLNELDRRREIRVSIDDPETTDAEFERAFDFPAGGFVLLRLNVPSRYEVSFQASGTTLGSATIGSQWFDCNASRSRFGVRKDGVKDYEERTTLMGCPEPAVAGSDLSVADRRCASAEHHDASIGFDGEAVTVDGTVLAATPCRKLSIETAAYDAKADRLTVVIGTAPSEGVCTQCLGSIEYEATIEFENDLPSEVVVEHHSQDRKTTVATAQREKSA
jgi:hypothetical protein